MLNKPTMLRVRLAEVRGHGAARPDGYAAALEAAGTVEPDGVWLRVGAAELEAVKQRFGVDTCQPGLGDLVHSVAGPVGKLLHWPCNERLPDGTVTAELRPGSPCAKMRERLNSVRL